MNKKIAAGICIAFLAGIFAYLLHGCGRDDA